jgi:hypothetical protein
LTALKEDMADAVSLVGHRFLLMRVGFGVRIQRCCVREMRPTLFARVQNNPFAAISTSPREGGWEIGLLQKEEDGSSPLG